MKNYLDNMNLVDLISEMHKILRNKVNNVWDKNNIEKINQTESHILGILGREKRTVAELSRDINISRQAAHKCVQNLIKRGYLTVEGREGNNKEKLVRLTVKGEKCNDDMLFIKQEIEAEIIEEIGESSVEIIKLLLKKKWID